MESDNDSVEQSSVAQSDTESNPGNLPEVMWDKFIEDAISAKLEYWRQLVSTDVVEFKLKFKEYFFEICQQKLFKLFTFLETDDVWASVN